MSLHTACQSFGDTLAAIALIEKGADVNEKDIGGNTPLHYACDSGHTATAVNLIERGASVNEKDKDGWTPLYCACIASRSATAIVLLENGAVGLNDRSSIGRTPSYYACLSCTADVVLRIIRHGAILTAADLQRFRDRGEGGGMGRKTRYSVVLLLYDMIECMCVCVNNYKGNTARRCEWRVRIKHTRGGCKYETIGSM